MSESRRNVYAVTIALCDTYDHQRTYRVLASDPISACELVMNTVRRLGTGDRFRGATERNIEKIECVCKVDIEEHEVQPKMVTDGSPYR